MIRNSVTMKKIVTFDDWIDAFRGWQKDIDLRAAQVRRLQLRGQVRRPRTDEIEFGDFRARRSGSA